MFTPTASLTFANASQVLEQGLRAIAAGQTSIDLTQVASVDSSAIAILLAWRRAALARNAPLELGLLSPNLQSLAELYGVSTLLQGAPSASSSVPVPASAATAPH